jgi:hypothetical protein
MTTQPTTWLPRRTFSWFAAALLVGGLLAVGTGTATILKAKALEDSGVVLPGVVTQVGDRHGRFIPVTYRYEAPGPDGRPVTLEKTVSAHHSRVENWAAGRKVEVRADQARPTDSNLVENNTDFAAGAQWVLFGVVAVFFGAIRLRSPRPEEAL